MKTLALDLRDTLVLPIDDQFLGQASYRAAQLRENQRRASYDPCDGCWRRVPPLGIVDIVKVVETWEAALG